MNIIITFLYMLFFGFIIYKSKKLTKYGFNPLVFVLLFVAKCVAGFLYNYVALKYIPNQGDIWPYYEDGLLLYNKLKVSTSDWWLHLKTMLTITDASVLNSQSDATQSAYEGIKVLQFIFNLCSFGNLYTNTVFFNAIVVFSIIRFICFLKKNTIKILPALVFILVPSAFFYTSGILKEGIILILLLHLLVDGYYIFKSISFAPIFRFVICLALLLFFKFFVGALFIWFYILWALLHKYSMHKFKITFAFIIVTILLFFTSSHLKLALNIPNYITERQSEFLKLPAASAIPITKLNGSFWGFIKATPLAIKNSFFSPLPGQGGKLMYLAYSAEMIVYWLLIIYLFARYYKQMNFRNSNAMYLVLLIFSIANLLIIGYTIPNVGAIMRYRSLFFPALLAFVVASLGNSEKFKKFISFKFTLQ